MKPSVLSVIILSALPGFALPRANGQADYYAIKEATFSQTSAQAPTSTDDWTFFTRLFPATDGQYPAATLTLPNSAVLSMVDDSGAFDYLQTFSSQSALDSAFPEGTYTYTGIDGSANPPSGTLTMPAGGMYPDEIPYFTEID